MKWPNSPDYTKLWYHISACWYKRHDLNASTIVSIRIEWWMKTMAMGRFLQVSQSETKARYVHNIWLYTIWSVFINPSTITTATILSHPQSWSYCCSWAGPSLNLSYFITRFVNSDNYWHMKNLQAMSPSLNIIQLKDSFLAGGQEGMKWELSPNVWLNGSAGMVWNQVNLVC